MNVIDIMAKDLHLDIDYLNSIGWMQEHDRILTESAQSVTPKQRTGHWIMTSDYLTTAYGSIDYVKCSCCGEDSLEEGDFCPNCGAKMEGESEC